MCSMHMAQRSHLFPASPINLKKSLNEYRTISFYFFHKLYCITMDVDNVTIIVKKKNKSKTN